MKIYSIVLLLLLFAANSFAQSVNIGEYIQRYTDENNSTGTIIIHKDGNVIYNQSFGSANLQYDIPNTNDTKYKVASITKSFTAVIILQLYERGKIGLHDPIKEYLPEYSGEGAETVTIHHLLTHTSGIENVEKYPITEFEKPWFDIYQKPYSTDEILHKFCSEPLDNEPGTQFDYNNGEYIILGKIIEQIYDKTFDRVLEDQILQPLQMNNSGMFYQAEVIKNIANTYRWNDSLRQFENDRKGYIENWYASGAMYSTANDLLKFSNALFGNELLKEESLELMLDPFLAQYGYGVWIRTIDINGEKHRIMQRYGWIRGANTVWFRFIDQDLTIIVLSNSDTTNLNDFAHGLARRLGG